MRRLGRRGLELACLAVGLGVLAGTVWTIGVGTLIAERAKEAGVTTVVFDRGGYQYHGRVKALADAALEAGLEF